MVRDKQEQHRGAYREDKKPVVLRSGNGAAPAPAPAPVALFSHPLQTQ